MVKILNGEIVQDDDPRLGQRNQQQQHSSHRPSAPASSDPTSAGRRAPAAAAAATAAAGGDGFLPGGFSSGFDFSAPAVKVVPRADAPGGIPDVELFALRIPGAGLLGVAAAGAFFGLRGLLAAAVLGYLYLRTSAGTPAREGPPPTAGARGGGFFMQQQQQQQEQEGGFGGGLQQRPGQGSAAGQSTAFQGKAYKLGAS